MDKLSIFETFNHIYLLQTDVKKESILRIPSLLVIEDLLKQIREIIRESPLETGFYLVGIWDEIRGESLVIDFFEFNYVKRNSIFIETDPYTKIMLINALPIGLRILGHIHSHPFLGSNDSINPSSIDISTFKSYEKGFFGISNLDGDVTFYYSNGKTLIQVDFSIISKKEFQKSNLLKLYNVNEFPVIVRSDASDWEIHSIIFKGYQEKSNLINFLSKIKLGEYEAKMQKPAWIDIVKLDSLFEIPYRLYFHVDEKDSLIYKIKNLFGDNIEIYNEKMEKISMKNSYLEKHIYGKIFVKKVK